MSHQFESGMFVGQPAWHRLGVVLNNPPTIEEAIYASSLNWQVIEEPMYRLVEGQPKKVEGYKALVRDSDSSTLGVVTDYYQPLQNLEAFKFFDFLLHDGDATLETAGSLKSGKRVWVLAKLTQSPQEVQQGDAIAPYLLLHNAHDGSAAVWIQFCNIRVVCNNTLSMAASSAREGEKFGRAIRIRHSSSVNEQLRIAKQVIDVAKRRFTQSIADYKAMAQKPISQEIFEHYISRSLNVERPVDTRAYPHILQAFEAGRGNYGKTLWDAYNAVTEWIDHTRGRSEVSRLESAWFGEGSRIKDRAYEQALALL